MNSIIKSIQMNNQDLTIETVSSFNAGKFLANVKITPPKLDGKRNNIAIICVLDISGSMDCEAIEGQSKESDGFSRLDLVKHSVNTIIHSLEAEDMLGVVTFSDKARVDLNLTKMNGQGKDNALKMITNMKTQGCTNLWDGIKNGLDLSKSQLCDDKNTFVLVLSDGQPNQHPPEGELGALKNYLKEYPLTCNLSMFGYGYNLDAKLLTSITQLGGGCYGFIPDCSMVGTIFVNFLSHSLASYTSLMKIEAKVKSGKLISLNGQNTNQALMGSSQFGFTRNCMIEVDDVQDGAEVVEITVRYGKNLRKDKSIILTAKTIGENNDIKVQHLRYKYINFLNSAFDKATQNKLQHAKNEETQLVKQMQTENKNLNSEYLSSLIRDMESKEDNEGQVGKALEKSEWWTKWGKHYLPALRIAHIIEMCTNFKDPGLQGYGSELFRENESKIDTIFIKLPPPTPTIKKYDDQGNVHQVNNMAGYYNRYGGCIHGDCTAILTSGVKKVKQLKKGDIVKTHLGYSKIKCVVVTEVGQQIEMVRFDQGLIITNYHPVLVNNQWKFPIDVKPAQKLYVDKYFNFVLEEGHSLVVNGIHCITLGHGMKGEVVEHEYLGTQRIINDLQKLNGWSDGEVSLDTNMLKRDPRTNLIVGISQEDNLMIAA